jgi:hypothetical protein
LEELEEVLEDVDWMTVGMVCWRDMEGILVVVWEFLRMERGGEAVVMMKAKAWLNGGSGVTVQ